MIRTERPSGMREDRPEEYTDLFTGVSPWNLRELRANAVYYLRRRDLTPSEERRINAQDRSPLRRFTLDGPVSIKITRMHFPGGDTVDLITRGDREQGYGFRITSNLGRRTAVVRMGPNSMPTGNAEPKRSVV